MFNFGRTNMSLASKGNLLNFILIGQHIILAFRRPTKLSITEIYVFLVRFVYANLFAGSINEYAYSYTPIFVFQYSYDYPNLVCTITIEWK